MMRAMSAKTDSARIIRWILNHSGKNQKEVARYLGVSQGTISKLLSGQHDPEAALYQRMIEWRDTLKAAQGDDDRSAAAGVVSGRRIVRNVPEGAVPEFDHFGGAGGGGYPLPSQVVDGERTYGAEVVSDSWVMPVRFLRDELRVSLNDIDIIRIKGDSMETGEYGGFRDGDRVVIDRSDRSVRQGGIFAVRDDDDIIVKQVELQRNGGDIQRIICKSLNRNYDPIELVLNGSAEIIGRVVLKISRT